MARQNSSSNKDDPLVAAMPEEDLDKMLEEYKDGLDPDVLRLLNQLKNLETPEIESLDDLPVIDNVAESPTTQAFLTGSDAGHEGISS